ncbi:hypothetical protein DSM3645_02678 [Blastopirellula marina DSM 3645]|uniref:Uncharacterized protein n=1 Tax=Blastopirellula marina DSM 3645 TaxID=314230 RepID=A3ZVJ9_9BACT|nr:hypothetical protein DSM3645_02678 [Blastopirellula marina DSM 3645]
MVGISAVGDGARTLTWSTALSFAS